MNSTSIPAGPEQLRQAAASLAASSALRMVLNLARARQVQVFLVGGTVRELALGGRTPDLDLAVSQHTLELARELAQTLGGTYVLLDEKERTARVVAGDDILDLAEFRGPTLAEDLKGRDFTINAMALELAALFDGRPLELIDPWGGLADLKAGRVRMLAAANLAADPLRLLRAYRFAATHGFAVTPETAAAIQTLAPALAGVSGERLHYELFQLLGAARAARVVRAMDRVGLLLQVFPELADLKGVPQNGYHHLDVFEHSLETLACLEEVLAAPEHYFRELAAAVRKMAAAPNQAAVLKIAALFHDVGKPQVQERRLDPERYTFYHHERVGVEIFQRAAKRLRFSQAQTKAVIHYITWHMRPFLLLPLFNRGELTVRALGRLVKAAGGNLPGCLALALADSLAGQGPLKPADADQRLAALAEAAWKFYQERLAPARPPRLLSGDDLVALGLTPGPEFRRLLTAVEEAQWEGEIATREEALALVRRLHKDKRFAVVHEAGHRLEPG
uniref:HD domain-containing protein n=1 Tax=Desulfobacca acetoxidans TaxID=60893 RepID=A0A7C3ZDC9_9BACT